MSEDRKSALRGLVQHWLAKIELAAKARRPWKKVSDQCAQFFFADSGFMWKQEYLDNYIGQGITPPKFQMTPNESFKLVSVMGPSLFWQYPNRRVKSFEPIQIGPEVFGNPEDPAVMEQYESLAQIDAMQQERNRIRNALMEAYLNYSQREQPGGLDGHGRALVTEMMVRGRSLLVPQTYTPPGSDRVLTGLFFKSSVDLFIDPDAESSDLSDASWIALRWESKTWELEERFGLPKGAVKGDLQSTDELAREKVEQSKEKSRDTVVWYEVFSKAGIGTRFDGVGSTNLDPALGEALDKTVGDYAYLVLCDTCDYFLNATEEKIKASEDEAVQALFAWPLESWRDNRWPVAILDSHSLSGTPLGAWPMPPLGPTLGYLTSYNVLMSAFVEQAYNNRKVLIGALQSEAKAIRKALESMENPAVVEVADGAAKSISDLIQYLTVPNGNFDILKAIEFVKQQIEEGTGLTPHVFAQAKSQSRSAEDVRVKEERATVRQEQMARDVARCITEASQLEMFLAALHVNGDDLLPRLGVIGVEAWKSLITGSESVEELMREMRATVEASDIRRPSKARETANMETLMERLLPVVQVYAQDTGDTQPVMWLVKKFGESIEQSMTGFEMGEWRPQPDEQAQQEMQAEQEMASAEHDMDMQKMEADVQAKQIDAQTKIALAQAQLQLKQQEMQLKMQSAEQEMAIDAERAQQEMALAALQGRQQIQLNQAMGQQKIQQGEQAGAQKLAQNEQMGKQKVAQAKAQAKAKPKAGSRA